MDDLSAADVDTYMVDVVPAGVKEKIAGLDLTDVHRFPLVCLISGTPSGTDAKV